MTDYEKIAEDLIEVSKKVINLIKTKNEYAKTINYQINQLFQRLGKYSDQEGVLIIDIANLDKKLNRSQLNILFSRDNRQSSYITPEDLCAFLHISKHNLKRTNSVTSIDNTLLNQFYQLLDAEEELQEDLIGILESTNIETWFGEVDFFNNGYIDTSALHEYFLHYDSQQNTFEEYNALIILKMIKRHSVSDKLVLQDFKHFIAKTKEIQLLLTVQQLSPIQSIKIQPKPIENHRKNRSNELYSLSSEISIAPEIKIGPKLTDHHFTPQLQSLSVISRQQIEQQLRQQENMTYQERLIRLHSRNEKYIKAAKKQMEGIIPICNVQIQSHLRVQSFKASSTQLIRTIRLLGDIYNRTIKLIKSFITKNIKFTFLNAFSMLDVEETNAVTLHRWKEFFKELQINVSHKKLGVFFNTYSKYEKMTYSYYLKIFKYASIEDEYVRCSTRYPLIYESWSDELIENYKTFLVRMIRLVEERQILKADLQKEQQQLAILLGSFKYVQEITEILGNQYCSFANEYFISNGQSLICRMTPVVFQSQSA